MSFDNVIVESFAPVRKNYHLMNSMDDVVNFDYGSKKRYFFEISYINSIEFFITTLTDAFKT